MTRWVVGLIAIGSVDTVARKIALASLPHYPFLLSQLSAIVYLTVYCLITTLRHRSLWISDDQLSRREALCYIKLWDLIWIGASDAAGSLLGNIAAARIIGYQLPLLVKLNIPFSALFSALLLQRQFYKNQYAGMVFVVLGGVAGMMPQFLESGSGSSNGGWIFLVVYIVSVAATALSLVLKERIFLKAKQCLVDLDVFLVLSCSNVFTLLFSFLLLPVSLIPELELNVPVDNLSKYLSDGMLCLGGQTCVGCPLAPMVYMSLNVLYNVCVQFVLKHGGALLMLITNTVTFPLSTLAFLLPWPLLSASKFNIWILVALAFELVGIYLYQSTKLLKLKSTASINNTPEQQPLVDQEEIKSEQ